MSNLATERSSTVELRRGRPEDAETLGQICFEAFRKISSEHNFAPDFPEPEAAVGLISMLLSRPDVYSVTAVKDGKPVGSNFTWVGDPIAGIGPITIDPGTQNAAVGRALMENALQYADEKGFLSVRLVQAAFHNRSLSLYTKLGFDTVEPLSTFQGPPVGVVIEGRQVRSMTTEDQPAVDDLCFRVHGHRRTNEIAGAIQESRANVVEHDGRITGYTTGVGYFGHTVGESDEDLKALIAAAENFAGPGFLLPTRNGELMRWCLDHGLRIVQPMTLMSRGVYQEPRGAFMPSIIF